MSAYFKREAKTAANRIQMLNLWSLRSPHLTGDDVAAQNAIEKAILHGDKSRDARNLKQLVDDALNERNDELLASEQTR